MPTAADVVGGPTPANLLGGFVFGTVLSHIFGSGHSGPPIIPWADVSPSVRGGILNFLVGGTPSGRTALAARVPPPAGGGESLPPDAGALYPTFVDSVPAPRGAKRRLKRGKKRSDAELMRQWQLQQDTLAGVNRPVDDRRVMQAYERQRQTNEQLTRSTGVGPAGPLVQPAVTQPSAVPATRPQASPASRPQASPTAARSALLQTLQDTIPFALSLIPPGGKRRPGSRSAMQLQQLAAVPGSRPALTRPQLQGAQCDCRKPAGPRKQRKPRTVCYRGSYIETASGLTKHKREKVPCR